MDNLELVRISDLPNKPHSVRIQVRIIRVWAASPPDSAVIWYYGTVLLDAHGGVIEARIQKVDYQRLSRLIEEGRICEIAKFSVADAPVKYHVVPGKHIVYFTRQTTVTPLAPSSIQIPARFFAFERLDIIGTEIKDKNKIIDLIGRIAGFSPVKQTSQSKPYQIMYLADQRGSMVEVTLWSQFLAIFDIPALYEQSMIQPVVVICAAVQINEWDHVYGVKAISGTRFYFDRTIPEIVEFVAALPKALPAIILNTEGPPYDGTAITNVAQHVDRPEPQTVKVSEFLAVPVDAYSDTSYKCVATIIDLKNRYQWHYQACKKCLKKLKEKYCEKCDMYRNDYMNWYKLLLTIRDETNVAEVVALGKIAKQMTGIDVDDMIQIQETTKTDVPPPLLKIIGQAYEFLLLPKEVPNYPGIRRNTIIHLDAVPPNASPYLLIGHKTDAETSSRQEPASDSEQPAHEHPPGLDHETEKVMVPPTTPVISPATPAPILSTVDTVCSTPKQSFSVDSPQQNPATITSRKRLFTDEDLPPEQTVSAVEQVADINKTELPRSMNTKAKKLKSSATASSGDADTASELP